MNAIIRQRPHARITQAAEGLPRWRWTTAELLRLAELGAFDGEDRFELIGGEIVPISPKGRRHEVVADELAQFWGPRASADIRISSERQLNLDTDTYTDPDLLVRPVGIKAPDVRGDTALLVVEVADSSLSCESSTKAALYARYGVREYWVINAQTMETTLHREPGAGGYANTRTAAATETLVPLLAPALAVRLADLDLE
jgi:Uma2 family endonuclease